MNREKEDQRNTRDDILRDAHATGEYKDQFCSKGLHPIEPDVPGFMDALNQRRANRGQPPIAAEKERKLAEEKEREKSAAEAIARKDKLRQANVEHRKEINRQVYEGLLTMVDPAAAKRLLLALRDGKIPHVSINY